jgi:hypothetical protein
MELTKISNENINKILKNNECKKEITKKFKNNYFIKVIYKLLLKAVKTNIKVNVSNIKENVSVELSTFIPKHIKEYIEKQNFIFNKITMTIYNKNFTIYVFSNEKINIQKLAYYLKIILYLCTINSKHTQRDFTFKLYLTNFPKIEPIIEVEPKHINSGFTVNHKSIVIFRKEELYKVFIHECFHMFCLDFSNIDGINYVTLFNSTFKIKSDFLLFESFCEYWARTLNTSIVAFHSLNNISFKDFQDFFQLNINIERCFSLLQMNHFLKRMNITYEEIINGKAMSKYKEKTNGFCYYVLTSLLMYNYEQTMEWFMTNNETIINFSNNNRSIYMFSQFIKLIHNKPEYLQFIKKINNITIKNMHMSVFEINCF